MGNDLTPILCAVRDIVKEVGRKGMHVREIAEAAVLQNKNMGLAADDFQKKMQSALAANLKLKTAKPTFAQVKWDKGPRTGKPKQGWYRLKEERTTPVTTTVSAPLASPAFLGKAGEYAVMSELLFWEFNVSQMTVDDGIDLVASKNNKFFFIQVKTSSRQASGRYSFSISKTSFNKYQGQNVYYVFVLRQDMQNEYITLPGTVLDSFVKTGVIKDGPTLSITLLPNEKKTEYMLNGKADVKHYFGQFGGIIV